MIQYVHEATPAPLGADGWVECGGFGGGLAEGAGCRYNDGTNWSPKFREYSYREWLEKMKPGAQYLGVVKTHGGATIYYALVDGKESALRPGKNQRVGALRDQRGMPTGFDGRRPKLADHKPESGRGEKDCRGPRAGD